MVAPEGISWFKTSINSSYDYPKPAFLELCSPIQLLFVGFKFATT